MLPNNQNNKSRIPVAITSRRLVRTAAKNVLVEEVIVVTPAKLEKTNNNNKSTLFSTTCSRSAQEALNYNKRFIRQTSNKKPPLSSRSIPNKMTRNLRKSPITQLKEDLETLRQKKSKDELLIKAQEQEILELNKQLQIQAEMKQALAHKEILQSKLKAITAETENLSIDVVDLLDVKSLSNIDSYTDQIQKLQSQLASREDDFKRKLDHYQHELNEKDQLIHKQRANTEQLKVDHANQIAQLNSMHMNRIHKLQIQQDKEQTIPKKPTPTPSIDINHLIEQALNEFEQEQHNHAPSPIIAPKPLVYQPITHNKSPAKINQQWYVNKYIPLDAMSWPLPQSVPSLKRQLHI